MSILITVPSPLEFEKLHINNIPNIQYLVSGVGNLATFAAISNYFFHHPKIDLIVQVGVAGSFEKSSQIGDVLFVQQDVQADLGKMHPTKGWIDIFDFGFDLGFPAFYTSPFLENPYLQDFQNLKLPVKKAVTVQQRHTDSRILERLSVTYQAQICSMEGFAVHFFGHLHKIPFIQMRAISNDVSEIELNKTHIEHSLQQLKLTLHQFISCYHDYSTNNKN
ncbi:MAG: hypothetical protein ORN85_01065 [Sediminibacterium sp.]|nr:hypothetical protein [Sediminibacterium sp.]